MISITLICVFFIVLHYMSQACVIEPVKTIPGITYMLFVATLNHIHVILGQTLASTLQCNFFQ